MTEAPLFFAWTKRATALKYECPECKSAPGQACQRDPVTIPSHQARHDAAIAAGEAITKTQPTSKKQREAWAAAHAEQSAPIMFTEGAATLDKEERL